MRGLAAIASMPVRSNHITRKTLKKKADYFDILKAMCDRNKDIALAVDQTNFQRQEKKGGGIVTIGVADPHFTYLINQAASGIQTHMACLLIYNIAQFQEIKKELEL